MCWQHALAACAMGAQAQAQADWCSRAPGFACPSHACMQCIVRAWGPSAHATHRARREPSSAFVRTIVRSHRPAPGYPSDASSARYEPCRASWEARQPTQRKQSTRGRAQFVRSLARHPNESSSKATMRPLNARFMLPVPYKNPSAPAMRPISPRSACGAQAQ